MTLAKSVGGTRQEASGMAVLNGYPLDAPAGNIVTPHAALIGELGKDAVATMNVGRTHARERVRPGRCGRKIVGHSQDGGVNPSLLQDLPECGAVTLVDQFCFGQWDFEGSEL